MKNFLILLVVFLGTNTYANQCDKSLEDLQDYITFRRAPQQFTFTRFDSGFKLPEPMGGFVDKYTCSPSRISHLPVINFDCLKDSRAYVRDALRLFSRDVTSEIESLHSLVDLAQNTRIASFEIANKLEKMLLADIGNKALTQERKNYYMGQFMNFEQMQYGCYRHFGNQQSSIIATGNMLAKFTPYLDGEESIVSELFGFESVNEVTELKNYLTNYGRDLRDAPIEIEMAAKELSEVSKRFQTLHLLLQNN
jgi:hypothetical protein